MHFSVDFFSHHFHFNCAHVPLAQEFYNKWEEGDSIYSRKQKAIWKKLNNVPERHRKLEKLGSMADYLQK